MELSVVCNEIAYDVMRVVLNCTGRAGGVSIIIVVVSCRVLYDSFVAASLERHSLTERRTAAP